MAPFNEDYYTILQIDRGADQEAIRASYRSLARKLHPDVNKAENAQEEFSKLQQAYDTLSDPEKKKLYDYGGKAAVSGGKPKWSTGPIPGLDEIFQEMFTGGRPGSPSKGSDIRTNIQVTFLTAALGGFEQVLGREGKNIELTIPAGVESGQELRIRGQGELGANGAVPGDLLVRVDIGGHPWFRRKGLDLFFELPITFAEAIRGGVILIPHLRGEVEITVPRGTSSGTRMRLPGFGVHKGNGDKGDYFVEIKIVVPKEITSKMEDLLDNMDSELENPRQGLKWVIDG